MHKTGLEDYYVIKGQKKMRFGYTTGSCAAAASKAAAQMLLSGKKVEEVSIMTPKGIRLSLVPEDICFGKGKVSCAIRKDGGDDPDTTSGILVYASVEKTNTPGILIDGGIGVGRGNQDVGDVHLGHQVQRKAGCRIDTQSREDQKEDQHHGRVFD